jgi:cellulose synthase/poly-beta-1,6-N-acetylglucosamine synthase-like glycosyltransferase
MSTPTTPDSFPRPVVSGKFFRAGDQKFYPKGVTYGPFSPASGDAPFASPDQTARDFELIRQLGANLLRVYHVPPPWFLDLAASSQLRLLIDIPWNKHLCFLDSPAARDQARQAVRRAVANGAAHPAVFAYSVVNELPPDIVRWSGARAVENFLDELADTAKNTDPDCLCTFANYPTTEFLNPPGIDFLCFNVFLHQPRPFENYLARLQMMAGPKPLLLGETGLDSLREGEAQQSETLAWQIELAFRGGLAGIVIYSFTDEWHKDGRDVSDWNFGLTTSQRRPKPSFAAVQQQFRAAPFFPLPRTPKISVVVACYNGARTLKPCLDSLARLNYPDYEILVVDDGSTDATPQIVSQYKNVRGIRQDHLGLSAARNAGIAAAAGEIVAFTDADCRADEDWLYYLAGGLLNGPWVGMGGHNLPPRDDSAVAAAVMASPGGPAHVMLTDRLAEHIPGCNMAFHKWALAEIGCFDTIFDTAGDDVDICWRLQQRGWQIGFCPGGFVWHCRRSTVAAYLEQQRGYGEAEAMLARRHPEYFNSFGGGVWRGRIYGPAGLGLTLRRPVIYRGLFATGFFQSLYQAAPDAWPRLCASLEYHALVNLPLLALSAPFHFFRPLAAASLALSFGVCVAAAAEAPLARNQARWWSRPLVTLLFFLQPIQRGWARYRGRLRLGPVSPRSLETFDSLSRREGDRELCQSQYWSRSGVNRLEFLARILARLEKRGWQFRVDTGWSDFDVEIFGSRWASLQLATVAEPHPGGKLMLRCRLRSAWPLASRAAFFALLGLELVVIGWLCGHHPWIWFLLLTLPAFPWFIIREQRGLLRMISSLLDWVAADSGLTKLSPSKEPAPEAAAR